MGASPVTALITSHEASVDAGLLFRRIRSWPDRVDPSSMPRLLGVRTLENRPPEREESGSADGDAPLDATLLWPPGVVCDAWFGPAVVTSASTGSVQTRVAGPWVYGSAWIAPERVGEDLEGATCAAYSELFSSLAHLGNPHLLRLWNYVPGINIESRGMERYRAFNAGRQRAFMEARLSAFEGAPAACALGTRDGGPMRVFFLAGPNEPVTIENPRQVSAYHYPKAYGARSPTFSRAAWVDTGCGGRVLFISGTASIQGHATVHAGDVRRQTEETLVNIEAVLDAAQRHVGAPLSAGELCLTVYVRHRRDFPVVRNVLESRLGAHCPAAESAVYLLADVCRSDLLVEIEAHATLGSGVGP